MRDLLGDGSTFKRRVKEGEGEFPADCPMHDCDIVCHYVARTIPDRTVVYGTPLPGAGQGCIAVKKLRIVFGIWHGVTENGPRTMENSQQFAAYV